MDQVEIERSEDLLFESELPAPCEGQSIKLWYDDFSGRVYPAMPPIYGQRMHQSYSLHYVTSGAGYFSVGDAPLCRLTVGQVFFVRARELVRYYPDPEAPWQYCGMSLCGAGAGAFFRRIGWDTSRVLDDPKLSGSIGEVILGAVRRAEREGVLGYELLSRWFSVCALLEPRYAGEKPIRTQAELYVARAREYIEARYSDPEWRISELCRALSLSHPYLCRIFRRSEGISPERYLLRHRMTVAKRLLRSGEHTVGMVAFLCGYTDAAQFSRMYKREHGVSPRETILRKEETV